MQRQLGGVRLAVMRGNVEKVELLAKVVTVNVASPSFVGLSFSMACRALRLTRLTNALMSLKYSTLLNTEFARDGCKRFGSLSPF